VCSVVRKKRNHENDERYEMQIFPDEFRRGLLHRGDREFIVDGLQSSIRSPLSPPGIVP
jgi:hypothetical protein